MIDSDETPFSLRDVNSLSQTYFYTFQVTDAQFVLNNSLKSDVVGGDQNMKIIKYNYILNESFVLVGIVHNECLLIIQ